MLPEVYTQCILPHPLLQPYVRCFAVRKFDTGDCEFPKAMIADHEMTMLFKWDTNINKRVFGF